MRRAGLLSAVLLALSVGHAAADEAPPIRSEVPIREVVLTDGSRRYTIPVKVGATTIETGLDTGSSGLRVLPGVLGPDDAKPGLEPDTYSYGSGAELRGVVGRATVTVGDLSARTTLQMVRVVGCTAERPHCPPSRIPQAQYGVQGDGLPGEGFKAIVGVNMAEAEVATPLRAVGAKRWIVELPRPGETAPGRLILNPTDAETQGFVMLPVNRRYDVERGGLHDSIAGCLVNDTTQAKACGALLLDCGAPGIVVRNSGLGGAPWANGTPVTLIFYGADGKPRAAERLTIGLRSHASHLMYAHGEGDPGVTILSGLTAYFAFSVLYDPAHGEIGLRPRPQANGGPSGELVPAGA